jgi:uncharacterized protein YsxB (DUF464 family)
VITASFYVDKNNNCNGFKISGHALCNSENGGDIVCAGVTSAVMFAVNTITDFLQANADVKVEENSVEFNLLPENDGQTAHTIQAEKIIHSLKVHLEYINEQSAEYAEPYSKNKGICIKKIIKE